MRRLGRVGDDLQELIELGPRGVLFRLGWELRGKVGYEALTWPARRVLAERLERGDASGGRPRRVFASPEPVLEAVETSLEQEARARLGSLAKEEARGRLLLFGRWTADFGDPIDWHRDPLSGERWEPDVHWTKVLRRAAVVGDAKIVLEAGRFPQAYRIARAVAMGEVDAQWGRERLARQIIGFIESNPPEMGVHWHTAQEVAIRLWAWIFADEVLGLSALVDAEQPGRWRRAFLDGARFVERNLPYSERAVYNNHLLADAALLEVVGSLFPETREARRWRERAEVILTEQAGRQFYPDGGYIQQSHNYHRVALQIMLLTVALRRRGGETVPRPWLDALARSVDFLWAHQNPADGRLPNYGANDGALPLVLSTCDFSDFRPTLQAASLASRGERLYEPGPWDEEAAWLLGPEVLDAPVRRARRPMRQSFAYSGHHVSRGQGEGTFAAFRCGSLRDRFSQIDMLHLDLWWRGQNVLVDGGSYLYNGPPEWHRHFMSAASHNTITVDGRDQMVHHRKFKVIYPTRARVLLTSEAEDHGLIVGEHDGFRRMLGCVHRRSVLRSSDDLWVVADVVLGRGAHEVRLHWLGAPVPWRRERGGRRLVLETEAGDFGLEVFDGQGKPLEADVVAGREGSRGKPPRGWVSRYYGEKVAAPSLVVRHGGLLPLTLVSVVSARPVRVVVEGGWWRVSAGDTVRRFRLEGGMIREVGGVTVAGQETKSAEQGEVS